MRLYRVIPYDTGAAPTERGGVLFVPPGGGNRIDNIDLYDVLYLAATREGAIAEAFGRIPLWTPDTFVHGSGRAFALVDYEVPDGIALFQLDDVEALKSIEIKKPSTVVTRDRTKTHAWARTIFETGRYVGVSWWSYYGPDWTIVGLWDRRELTNVGTPMILSAATPIVKETAAVIVRQIA
ncbi:MAG: RES family NAD+ phosphorylase [Candidatus Eremiobacteraeota bacterium]|nr:RES family NAD+ phosphorylase [Candidatus Eremiobacteraeota bacterium]